MNQREKTFLELTTALLKKQEEIGNITKGCHFAIATDLDCVFGDGWAYGRKKWAEEGIGCGGGSKVAGNGVCGQDGICYGCTAREEQAFKQGREIGAKQFAESNDYKRKQTTRGVILWCMRTFFAAVHFGIGMLFAAWIIN